MASRHFVKEGEKQTLCGLGLWANYTVSLCASGTITCKECEKLLKEMTGCENCQFHKWDCPTCDFRENKHERK